MPKDTSQVQQTDKNLTSFDRELLEFLKENAGKSGAWTKLLGPTPRFYPGEEEAYLVTAYLNAGQQNPKQKRKLLGIMEKLRRIEQNRKQNSIPHGWRKDNLSAVSRLIQNSLKGVGMIVDLRNHLGLAPNSVCGLTLQNVLGLFEMGRLNRIRQCLRCREWYFARFKHQQFCDDEDKKCQWNYYHTPEWRKKNRERNRLYHQKYRKGLFQKVK